VVLAATHAVRVVAMNRAERLAALQLEADRAKWRLDQLDRQLRGDPDAWIKIIECMPDTVAEVVVDKLLAEVRQQAATFATIVRTIETLTAEEQAPQANAEDELVKRRQEREAARRRSSATLTRDPIEPGASTSPSPQQGRG